MPRRLNATQTAKALGVSRARLYNWINRGELEPITHVDADGHRYWLDDEVDTYLRSRCSATPPNGEAVA